MLVLLSLERPRECTKRSVSSDMNSKSLLEFDKLMLNKIGMQFNLINYWLDLAIRQHVQKHGDGAVADSQAFD